jgi:L-lactate dehydrogenase (cytochrome)
MEMGMKPRWWIVMLGTKRRSFRIMGGHARGVTVMNALSEWTAELFYPRLSWDDVKRIRDEWGGKLILKGILDPEDADMAAQTGADALIVSNHGGRQLDGAISSIAALPGIVDAVGSRIEVHMDGGIRTGQDVIKAIALGAKGVYVGRAFTYGLGAMGQEGVSKALEIIRKELDLTMALCGLRDIKMVTSDILVGGGMPAGASARAGQLRAIG